MAELEKVFIDDLQQLTRPEQLLGKKLELEATDANGTRTSFQAGVGLLSQAVLSALPGPNNRRDLRKAVRHYSSSVPGFGSLGDDSALDTLNPAFLCLNCECTVEFGENGARNVKYVLVYDSTGPLTVWRDATFALGGPVNARWVLLDSPAAQNAGIELYNAGATEVPKDALRLYDDRIFIALQRLRKVDFGGSIPSPLNADYWKEQSKSAPTALWQRIGYAALVDMLGEEQGQPGRLYRVTDRGTEPDVLVVCLTPTSVASADAYTVPAGEYGPLTPVSYDLENDETSARSSGGGGFTFTRDIVVSLPPGYTGGKYTNGQTMPLAGKNPQEAFEDVFIANIYPTYLPASVSTSKNQADDGEIGESVNVTLTGSFNQNDAGTVTALRAYKVTGGTPTQLGAENTTGTISRSTTVVRAATPVALYVVADYAAGPRKLVQPAGTADDRAPQVRNPNAPQAAEIGLGSNVVYIGGSYKSYFGYSAAAVLDMTGLIALGGGVLQNGKARTIGGVTATAEQYTYYCYVAAAGDLSSIILDGAAPVLGAFTKLADVTGPNAQGVQVTLRVYRSNAKGAFSNNSLAFS